KPSTVKLWAVFFCDISHREAMFASDTIGIAKVLTLDV
ncbi:MAG: hypothetical protein ACI9T9_000049, partial [Oleiphilaceae bacterium]